MTLPVLNLSLFVGLVLVMAGLTLRAVGRAGRVDNEPLSTSRRWMSITGVGLLLWLGVTFVLAKRGVLADFSSTPAPFMIVSFAIMLITIFSSAASRFGKRLAAGLSLYTLFGFQVFRLVVEIVLLLQYKQGVAPVQVTFEGRNWDMVTGILALGVLVFFRNKPLSRAAYAVLNLIGLGLVLNVLVVSVLSLPTPFQIFMDDNTWVTQAPYAWLPTFLVPLAIAGHILSFRKLSMERESSPMKKLAQAS